MGVEKDVSDVQSGKFKTGWAILNRLRTKRAVSRAELLRARNDIAAQLVALEEKQREAHISRKRTEIANDELDREVELRIALHQLNKAAMESEAFLTKEAQKRGFTLANDQTLLVFEETSKIRVATQLELERGQAEIRSQEEDEAMQRRIHEADAESDRKIIEHYQLSRIDVQKDYDIRMNQLKGILAVKLFTHTKLREIRGMVKDMLLELHEVEVSQLPPPVKNEYSELLRSTIDTYKRAYNEGQTRLLEGADGEDVGGMDENADI